MSLPYESATSGERALGEIQKLLRGFGCSKFGSMIDDTEGTLLVQFEYRGKPVSGVILLQESNHRPGMLLASVERRAKPNRDAEKISPAAAIDIARLASQLVRAVI